MKKYISYLILTFIATSVNAQILVEKTAAEKITIQIGKVLNKNEILTKLGNPERFEEHQDEAADGFMRNFTYQGLRLTTVDNVLESFGISSPEYTVRVTGGSTVKIGDSITDFMRSLPQRDVDMRIHGNSIQIFFKIKDTDVFDDDSLILYYDQEGKVTTIRWFSPV